jgi:PAS domain S-box-containing protein
MDRQFFEIESDLFRLSPQPIWIYNVETLEIIDMNNAACAKFNISLSEAQGHNIADYRDIEDEEKFRQQLELIRDRVPYERDEQAIQFNGRRIWVEIEFHQLFVSDKDNTQEVIIERDISARRYDRILNNTKSDIIEELAFDPDFKKVIKKIAHLFTMGRNDLAIAILNHDSKLQDFTLVAQDRLSIQFRKTLAELEYTDVKKYIDIIRRVDANNPGKDDDEFTLFRFPISKHYPQYRLIPIEGSRKLFGAIILYAEHENVLNHLNPRLIKEASNLLRITLKKAFSRKRLKENASRFEAVLNSIPMYISSMDLDGKHKWFESRHFALEAENFVGKRLSDIYGHELEYVHHFEDLRKCVLATGEAQSGVFKFTPEQREKARDGGQKFESNMYMRSSLIPILGETGEMEGLIHCGYDVTDVMEKEEALSKTLEERNTLLAEIHHRVKNNLAVVSSLLGLQEMSVETEDAIRALAVSQSRIQAMKHVHENLYNHELLTEVRIKAFLNEHIDKMRRDKNFEDKKIEIHCDDIILDLVQAVPFGLAINEVLVLYCEILCPLLNSDEIQVKVIREDALITVQMILHNISEVPHEKIEEHINLDLIETILGMLKGKIDFNLNGKIEAKMNFALS